MLQIGSLCDCNVWRNFSPWQFFYYCCAQITLDKWRISSAKPCLQISYMPTSHLSVKKLPDLFLATFLYASFCCTFKNCFSDSIRLPSRFQICCIFLTDVFRRLDQTHNGIVSLFRNINIWSAFERNVFWQRQRLRVISGATNLSSVSLDRTTVSETFQNNDSLTVFFLSKVFLLFIIDQPQPLNKQQVVGIVITFRSQSWWVCSLCWHFLDKAQQHGCLL